MDNQTLNSIGNLICSEWSNNGIKLGNEEGLKGRSKLILDNVSDHLLNNYTKKEIENMTLLDIGSFDGYIPYYLSDLGFKKIVACEPRKKNIEKGISIRKFLNLEEKKNIEFIAKRFEDLEVEKKSFDVVSCFGIMHHIGDHFSFIKKMAEISKKILVIDSRVVNDSIIKKKEAVKKSETLDVLYKNLFSKNLNSDSFFDKNLISFSINKFESDFNDSSTATHGLVTIPTTGSLRMCLKNFNFNKITDLVSPSEYRIKLNHKRPLDGYLFVAEKERSQHNKSRSILINYENSIKRNTLELKFLQNLEDFFIHSKKSSSFKYIIENFLLKNKFYKLFYIINKNNYNIYQKEIISNLHYSYEDKINFEIGKTLFFLNRFEEAKEYFFKIIDKRNSDFRSVYRSFYFMYKISKIESNLPDQKKFFKFYFRSKYGIL